MSIEDRQQELIAEFSDIEDWMDRYGYIIDLGNALPEIEESKKNASESYRGVSESCMARRRARWRREG